MMEFHISDLLDGMLEDTVEIRRADVPSSERIRQLTLQKIHGNNRPSFRGRRLTLLIAAVIFVLSLAVTAGAESLGISRWFQSFFREVTLEQEQILESMAMEQPEPVSDTVNGTTLTLVSAIGDGYNCYARIRFEAPEGTDLTRESENYYIYYQEYIDSENCLDLLSRPAAQYGAIDYTYKFTWEDTIPGDNLLEAVLHIVLDETAELRFDDEIPETITIPGLVNENEIMLTGPWQLTVTALGGETMALDVAGKTAHHTTFDCETELVLKRMVVSQVGIEVAANFSQPLTGESSFVYPTAYAVLTDGNVVQGSIAGYGYLNTLTSRDCQYKLYFAAPVELKDIDHIRFCGLTIPVSGDGSVTALDDPGNHTLGTHVTLGDPDSLRLSSEVRSSGLDYANMTSRQWDSRAPEKKSGALGYAEYTEEGVRYYQWSKTYGEGRLAVTITGARLVTNLADLDGSYAGFEYEAFLLWTENGWEKQEIPVGINPDGSFQEGAFLILLDMTLENQGVSVSENYWSPNQTGPYQFNTTGLPFFANIAEKDSRNYQYTTANYFTDEDGIWKNYVEVLPGERKQVTSGFFCPAPNYHGGNWTIENIRACNTSGAEYSVFIDLNLR